MVSRREEETRQRRANEVAAHARIFKMSMGTAVILSSTLPSGEDYGFSTGENTSSDPLYQALSIVQEKAAEHGISFVIGDIIPRPPKGPTTFRFTTNELTGEQSRHLSGLLGEFIPFAVHGSREVQQAIYGEALLCTPKGNSQFSKTDTAYHYTVGGKLDRVRFDAAWQQVTHILYNSYQIVGVRPHVTGDDSFAFIVPNSVAPEKLAPLLAQYIAPLLPKHAAQSAPLTGDGIKPDRAMRRLKEVFGSDIGVSAPLPAIEGYPIKIRATSAEKALKLCATLNDIGRRDPAFNMDSIAVQGEAKQNRGMIVDPSQESASLFLKQEAFPLTDPHTLEKAVRAIERHQEEIRVAVGPAVLKL